MGVETSLRVHNFVYTIQTVPLVGRVDLAAVFLDVAKLKNEHLFFSKFCSVCVRAGDMRVICWFVMLRLVAVASYWLYPVIVHASTTTYLSFSPLATLITAYVFITAGNFSDVSKYSCKGCQDGYLTEALVSQRHWTYLQLPIDGLKSMVFHGPSPTLCIASGEWKALYLCGVGSIVSVVSVVLS